MENLMLLTSQYFYQIQALHERKKYTLELPPNLYAGIPITDRTDFQVKQSTNFAIMHEVCKLFFKNMEVE